MASLRLYPIVLVVFCILAMLSARPGHARGETFVVGIGGNSECFHEGGTWQLLHGSTDRDGHPVPPVALLSLGEIAGVTERHVRYFSWTGDPASAHADCLPGQPNYIEGGAAYIKEAIKDVLGSGNRLIILGWSNGGATAYELACLLTQHNPNAVHLLVTLDPASWTTSPCTSGNGAPLQPALRWLNVYTESGSFWDRLRFGNIIAYFGRAWNDTFPEKGRPNVLLRLKPAAHGDVECMWRMCVLRDPSFQRWIGQSRLQIPDERFPSKTCLVDAACTRM